MNDLPQPTLRVGQVFLHRRRTLGFSQDAVVDLICQETGDPDFSVHQYRYIESRKMTLPDSGTFRACCVVLKLRPEEVLTVLGYVDDVS